MPDESKVVEAESSGAQDEKSLRGFWNGAIVLSVLIGIAVNLVFGFQVNETLLLLLAFIFGIISGGKERKDVFRAIRRMLLGGVIGCIVGAVMCMPMATVVRGATVRDSLMWGAVWGASFGSGLGLMSVVCARNGIWHQTLFWCAIGSIVGVIACVIQGITVGGGISGETFWNWAAVVVFCAMAGAEFGVASGGWRVLVILGWFLD